MSFIWPNRVRVKCRDLSRAVLRPNRGGEHEAGDNEGPAGEVVAVQAFAEEEIGELAFDTVEAGPRASATKRRTGVPTFALGLRKLECRGTDERRG